MKSIFLVMGLICAFTASAQKKFTKIRKYNYVLSLEKPVQSNDIKFKDDIVSIVFEVGYKGIEFKLSNLTEEPLKVIWDEVSIIFKGDTKKTIHKGIKLIEKAGSHPPTVIPPTGSIDDFAYPIENISYSSFYGWEGKDLFPESNHGRTVDEQYIQGLKGEKVGLYLPIEKSGSKTNYFFLFVISDIIPKK